MERYEQAYEQALERRALRALQILDAGWVRPNGIDGQYFVRSQSGKGVYVARVRRVTNGRIVCGCKDAWAKQRGLPCKHVLAAEMYEAEQDAKALADRHGLTIGALADQLLHILCGGAPAPVAERALELFRACLRIENRENRLRGR